MSSSRTPCAACKTLRRKCINECVFAPYFPADQPQRFESVHRVYGASNVAKILSDLPEGAGAGAGERAEAVSSLVYEAEARLKDPVYGCVGSISILQHKLKRIQTQIQSAKQELATFIGLNPNLHSGDAQQQQILNHHHQQQQLWRRFDAPSTHNSVCQTQQQQQQQLQQHHLPQQEQQVQDPHLHQLAVQHL